MEKTGLIHLQLERPSLLPILFLLNLATENPIVFVPFKNLQFCQDFTATSHDTRK